MKTTPRHEVARRVLPGYGFFGNQPDLRLSVPVEGTIDALRIGIQSGGDNYLNLHGIELFDLSNRKLAMPDIIRSAELSSTFDQGASADVTASVIEGRSIHTALERLPGLAIELSVPMSVGRIEIANRTGTYGQRARHLVLDAWCGSDEVVHYRNADTRGLLALFDGLVSRIRRPLRDDVGTLNEAYLEADALVRAIATDLADGHLACTRAEIMALLPMQADAPIVADSTLRFMGEAIAHVVAEKRLVQTAALKEFQHILSSPKRIDTATAHAAESLKRNTGDLAELVVAKHKIGYSDLLSRKKDYTAAMSLVQGQLQDWSIPSMLCYGTLLGAVREQGFIPHDDDVDMLYIDGSTSRDDMMRNRATVMERFREADYRIWDSGTNFHVTPPGFGVGVDLFPCWGTDDSTHLMMEKYLYRDIPTASLLPMGQIELYGETFPVPNDCAAFLEQRYGRTWTRSDPFHEWPWALDDPLQWPRRESRRELQTDRTLMVAWGQHVGPGKDSPPKNSPSLIRKALRQGYDAIEIDVRLSRDGVFVLGHDDWITGKGGRKVKISATDAGELAKFELEDHEGQRNTIIALDTALELIGDRIAHLDARVPPSEIAALRRAVDGAGFESAKIIFCGYGDGCVRELNVHFPESVVLYKYYGPHTAIDDFVLEELAAKQVDGLMLYWPMHYEECGAFTQRLREHGLQVLFYVHGSWPARGEQDRSDLSLRNMATAKVDYVTSTASNSDCFRQLVSSARCAVGDAFAPPTDIEDVVK